MDREAKLSALNQAAQIEAEAQAENLVVDFDAALKEWETKDKKPYLVKFLGKTYPVPREKPFAYALFVNRYCIRKRDGVMVFEIPDDKIEEFFRLMFGQQFLDALKASDVDCEFVLQKIVPAIVEMWGTPLKKGKNVEGTPAS
jgi:hypothetical protein